MREYLRMFVTRRVVSPEEFERLRLISDLQGASTQAVGDPKATPLMSSYDVFLATDHSMTDRRVEPLIAAETIFLTSDPDATSHPEFVVLMDYLGTPDYPRIQRVDRIHLADYEPQASALTHEICGPILEAIRQNSDKVTFIDNKSRAATDVCVVSPAGYIAYSLALRAAVLVGFQDNRESPEFAARNFTSQANLSNAAEWIVTFPGVKDEVAGLLSLANVDLEKIRRPKSLRDIERAATRTQFANATEVFDHIAVACLNKTDNNVDNIGLISVVIFQGNGRDTGGISAGL
jgi:hypothetical protein